MPPSAFPAAFGRLCVETFRYASPSMRLRSQPPSGGCVLKLCGAMLGCIAWLQPPSGGCVLKPRRQHRRHRPIQPAAFGRLCVETVNGIVDNSYTYPAAFGRLCVETPTGRHSASIPQTQPPSGGCVLKQRAHQRRQSAVGRPAAFGRLCVETS